jgi:hypothetical protein
MGEIIQFNQHRAEPKIVTNDVIALSKKDVHKVEHIRDSIETALEKVAKRKICLNRGNGCWSLRCNAHVSASRPRRNNGLHGSMCCHRRAL